MYVKVNAWDGPTRWTKTTVFRRSSAHRSKIGCVLFVVAIGSHFWEMAPKTRSFRPTVILMSAMGLIFHNLYRTNRQESRHS